MAKTQQLEPSPTAKRISDIKQVLALNAARVAEVEGLYQNCAYLLTKNPTDKTIKDELASLQSELDGLARERRIHEAALKAALQADTEEGRREMYRALESEMQKVASLSVKGSDLVHRIADRLTPLGADIMALAAVLEDRRHAAGNIIHGAADNERTSSQRFMTLSQPLAYGGDVASALAFLLYQTGFGRVGIDMGLQVSVMAPSVAFGRPRPLDDAIDSDNEKITECLQKLMTSKAKSLGFEH